MSETNYLQAQTCDHCHKPLYIVAGSPRVSVWEDGNVRNYHFKCIDPSYVVSHPDTGDTAALEMPKWVACELADARKMLEDEDCFPKGVRGALVWLADRLAALVQAERGRYDALLEAHRNFHNTVSCPGLPECFVCQLEESVDA